MIAAVILLTAIILNLAFISVLAFLGKKNLLLAFAILEALLAFGFAMLTSLKMI